MRKLLGLSNALAGLLAQVFSSLNSFLLIIVTAWYLTLGAHGYFVFGVAICQIILSLVRALCGETLIVLSTRGKDSKAELNAGLSAAGMAALIGALICVVLGLIWQEYQQILLVTAAVAIPVCIMDVVRYCAISLKRSYVLLTGDFLTCIGTISGLLIVGKYSQQPEAFLTVWGLACAIVAAFVGIWLQLRIVSIRKAWLWLKQNFSRSSAFFAEAALGATAGTAILAVMALAIDSEQISIFRTALTIMGITGLINNFLRSTILRELSPEKLEDTHYLYRTFALMIAAVSIVIIVFGLCIWLAPIPLTAMIFGDNFVEILPVLLFAVMHRIFASCSTIPTIFLRAQGITWSATRLRFIIVALGIIIGPLAAYFGGAQGAILGDMFTYFCLFIGLSILVIRTANTRKA